MFAKHKVLILAILGVAIFVLLRGVSGPFYLTSGDPSYFYLFNGLNPLHGLPYFSIDHPGTPVLMLSTLVLWISGGTPSNIYNHVELYLYCLYGFMLVVRFASLLYIGRRLSFTKFAFIALQPYMIGDVFAFTNSYGPDFVWCVLSPWLCYLLLKESFSKSNAFWLGVTLAIGVLLKMPFGIVVPLVFWMKRTMWRMTILGFFISLLIGLIPMLPVIPQYIVYMSSWITKTHGYADRSIPNYLRDIGNTFMSSAVFVSMIAMLVWRKSITTEWKYALAYTLLLFFVVCKWAVARYLMLPLSVLPVFAYYAYANVEVSKVKWSTILLIGGIPLLTPTIRNHTAINEKSTGPLVVAGYYSPSEAYALWYGYIASGRWLPLPPNPNQVLFLNTINEGCPEIPEDRFPVRYISGQEDTLINDQEQLDEKMIKITYLTNSKSYKEWFNQRKK